MRVADLLHVLCVTCTAFACGRVGDEEQASDAMDGARGDGIVEVAPESAAATDATEFPDTFAPDASLDYAPVCGSDGVMYWNADWAAVRGVGVVGASCTHVSFCGASSGKDCPSGTVCVADYIPATPTICSGSGDWSGECWYVPAGATCPDDPRQWFDCATSTCVSTCEIVRTGHPYRADARC